MANWFDYAIGRAHDPADNANGGELGVDLATPVNTPVTTPWGGVVTYAGSNASTGGIVKVWNSSSGIGSYFLHLNALAVKPGDTIQPGQTIGLSGGLQPGAGGWAHTEFGLFQDPKYSQGYWGFKSGSTLDPTQVISTLQHTAGGVLPDGVAGGLAGTAGLPTSQSGGQTIGQATGSGGIINITVTPFLDTVTKAFGITAQDIAWRSGLMLLGGALLVVGFFVLIWPTAKPAAETGLKLGAAAA